MKTPPLLLGAALVFWGWQCGLLGLAAIMALILEGSRLVKSRFDLSASDFNRISDLSAVLFMGMAIYLYAQNRSAHALLAMFKWLPVVLLPLLAAQAYSTSERIPVGAFFWTFRKRGGEKGTEQGPAVNLTYPYFALCILSASTSNVKSAWFYMGVFSLAVWALWFVRSKRFSPILWISLLGMAGFMGYAGHVGLHNLQITLEKKALDWFAGFIRRDADPYRTRTAIGDVGTLKLSDRILFRAKPEFRYEQPILLREASYNVHKSSMWFASRPNFKTVQPEADRTTWELQPGSGAHRIITVSTRLTGGKGMLKLPNGALEVTQLPVLNMVRNQFGAVKVEDGPGLITYRVRFDPYTSFDGPPSETDVMVPKKERPALSTIIQELGLTTKSPREILKSVSAFFQGDFTYSLILDRGGYNANPLAEFLLRSRSGHCEYFATATVLLLRAAGIPARYCTGYSVQEFSKMENRFVVRARHAHAWALVYMDGTWQDFDTTPSSWVNIEEKAASMWEPLYDLWSWWLFRFSEWRWRERGEGGMTKHMWWLLIPLIFLLAWRLRTRSRVRRIKAEREKAPGIEAQPGADSEFYLIEKRLIESGYMRHPWETLSSWIKRIEKAESLRSILALHYRYRFDPKGITADEKAVLKSNVQSWLEAHEEVRSPDSLYGSRE